tara:strand:+ start:2271 stop:2441 length:171 start_codon:yes stop_codon:yes gene_type:complete
MIQGKDVYAVNAMGPGTTFQDINSCFMMREEVLKHSGSTDGYFPPGKQAICVKVKE